MIELHHLTKRYGSHTAVTDLDVTIPGGQIHGLLGPNGAGKSTTMNMITGCLAATEGQVLVDGYDIFEESLEAKRRIGYLPEQPPLYQDMTPGEYLGFVARAKRIPRDRIRDQLDYVLEVTGTAAVADRLIRHLSKGYKQRVGIAQALLGEPEVIILDEPTVGLDPLQIIDIRDLIRELGKNHTVILSSHILSEVRAVCDSIMVISKGRLVAFDTPEELEKRFAGTASLELEIRAEEEAVRQALDGLAGPVTCRATDRQGVLAVSLAAEDPDTLPEQVFFALAGAGLPLVHMSVSKVSLEDVFLELTGEDTAESQAEAEQAGDETEADTAEEIEAEAYAGEDDDGPEEGAGDTTGEVDQ